MGKNFTPTWTYCIHTLITYVYRKAIWNLEHKYRLLLLVQRFDHRSPLSAATHTASLWHRMPVRAVFALRSQNLPARNSSLKKFKHEKEEKLAGLKGKLAGPAQFLVAEGRGPALSAKTVRGMKQFSSTCAIIQIKYVLPKLCHLPQYSYGSRDPTTRVLGYASYPGLGTRDPYSYWGRWHSMATHT